mmetsp:Transcript_21084/g.29189  ORF Transcript_21084/g.29189 Transcript_21084/m.29189 type:complete len:248 (+) Transcript_21084:102-845(+)
MAALTRSVSISARTSSLVQGSKLRSNRVAVAKSTRNVSVSAAARPLWLPGSKAPEYLDGSLPGDFGFDPLGLGSDPEMLKWFQQAELMHCRWAMLGTAGVLFTEAATVGGSADLPMWTEAGAKINESGITNGLTLFWMQMILMNWAEVRRWQDMKNPGSVNQDPIFPQFACTGTEVGYPGGRWFNPFSMAATEEEMAMMKVREIKNGRLAMLAMTGFATQTFITGEGPVANWLAHVSDPAHNTFFTR